MGNACLQDEQTYVSCHFVKSCLAVLEGRSAQLCLNARQGT